MNKDRNFNVKEFFISKIEELKKSKGIYPILDSQLKEPKWKKKIMGLKYLVDIEKYFIEICSDVCRVLGKNFSGKIALQPKECYEYSHCLEKDLESWENELDSLNNQYDTQKNLTK